LSLSLQTMQLGVFIGGCQVVAPLRARG
jgi:hypothetical protein